MKNNNNNIINIINEEINDNNNNIDFDFLGNDQYNKDQKNIMLLSNIDFQKQFICDTLLNKKDRIKIVGIEDGRIGGDWNKSDINDASYLTVDYYINIEYLYDSNKEPIKFDLHFNSDHIDISMDGNIEDDSYEKEGYSESWFNRFDWEDINVNIYDKNGDKIEFKSFKNAPINIRKFFVREYLENFIENETSSEIKNNIGKINNVDFC